MVLARVGKAEGQTLDGGEHNFGPKVAELQAVADARCGIRGD